MNVLEQHILIIEDEENIARVLQLELEFEGYVAEVAHTGSEGLIKYRENRYDLVLLDLMLPEMHGLDVLKRIRATESTTPVILLTAKSEVEDKVKGLDLGANDYVTKPFEIEELLARIRNAIRFSSHKISNNETTEKEGVLSYSNLTLNEKTREVNYDNELIELTPREFDLLLYLLKHPKQVLSRDQILEAVWGYDYYGETNVVDVYIRYVRQKLEKVNGERIIQTVRGVGYVLRETSE